MLPELRLTRNIAIPSLPQALHRVLHQTPYLLPYYSTSSNSFLSKEKKIKKADYLKRADAYEVKPDQHTPDRSVFFSHTWPRPAGLSDPLSDPLGVLLFYQSVNSPATKPERSLSLGMGSGSIRSNLEVNKAVRKGAGGRLAAWRVPRGTALLIIKVTQDFPT